MSQDRPVLDAPLRIGILAPPWVPVPPVGYGGTELVIDGLCRGLARAGHEVTLFTTGDSTCAVPKLHLFGCADADRIGSSVLELRHVAAAYDVFGELDLVHDHTIVGLHYAGRPRSLPLVTTIHGPFDDDNIDLYRRVADHIPVIAISEDQARRAPPTIAIAGVIHHGIDVDDYPFGAGNGEHVVFLGRMSADKGVTEAIVAARSAGLPLVIAAKMRDQSERRYFTDAVEPLLGHDVRYIGEADRATKLELLRSARALVNPLRWPEPFGLVMIESMACGTPVISFERGAAPEIVDDGVTGFLATNMAELVAGLLSIDDLDRGRCRAVVEERFSVARMTRDHLELYRRVLAANGGLARRHAATV